MEKEDVYCAMCNDIIKIQEDWNALGREDDILFFLGGYAKGSLQ